MKTPSPSPNKPETGVKYWRSLDHLADTPEFREFVEREFPAGASEFTDPVSRRHFVKIMSASFMLAGLGLTGCRRPEEKILPFSKMPENYVHGVPQAYATAIPKQGGAIPLVVRSHDGRPTKIEGNSLLPNRKGATDAYTQASILNLYDPDRAQRFTKAGNTVPRESAQDFLTTLSKKFSANQGQGLCVLMERSSSPSRDRLQQAIQKNLPASRWFVYEPVDLNRADQVLSSISGTSVKPNYHIDKAKVILSLDCDFAGSEDDTVSMIHGFAKGRMLKDSHDSMNRLYAVESLMTLTGMNADHRLRVAASQMVAVASAVALELMPQNAAVKTLTDRAPLPAHVSPDWIRECAKDLRENLGQSLVMAGHRQPAAVHALVALINEALQNVGKTLAYQEQPAAGGATLEELAGALNDGKVDTLVILGGNPVYNAPVNLDWKATQRKASTVVNLSYYEDETFGVSDWHLPAAHYLESWGDARTPDGTLVPVQPLIRPLFDGATELEVLARLGGLPVTHAHDIVRETFLTTAGSGDYEENWKKFLHDGFWPGTEYKAVGNFQLSPVKVDAILTASGEPPQLSKDNLEVVFHRDLKVDDGRYNNNGWLQELPDPITKVTWDGLVLVSRKTASELDVVNEDVVEIELDGRKIQGPIWVQPGLADNTLGLALGYGRQMNAQGGTGRVGNQVGLYDAYQIRAGLDTSYASGAKLSKTGETYKVSSTQQHGSMEGRPIVREANLKSYQDFPAFATNMDLEAHSSYIEKDPTTGLPLKIYETPYEAYDNRKSQNGVNLSNVIIKSDVHQWGMTIDLSGCVGCAACVVACQSENNIPIVGKDQVRRDREMHWIRIDRYFSGAGEKSPADQIDDPQVSTQPMLCLHCEDAPCESVCPVNATVHDEEGLNVMAYNRCVGTRYCSNNCPYKVRRFNFFDYNRNTIANLYKTPLATGHNGSWRMANWFKKPSLDHSIPEDEWDLMKLLRNPDVTVRMRGIMEKCTFCVQRIEKAKISQKIKAGESGDTRIPEGTFQTACEQACPADAIVFGNLLDPESRVSKLKANERNYSVLGFLDTRPRTTYLAQVRNPNPAMPDAHDNPLSLQEYMDQQHANPFEEHHGAEAQGAGGHGNGQAAETKGDH